ncbi:MAG: hypothetical protein C0417_05370 [Chlorobiaceae bacterium]|nr:hypothetical protein [Chlorobiaceae bacterium]
MHHATGKEFTKTKKIILLSELERKKQQEYEEELLTRLTPQDEETRDKLETIALHRIPERLRKYLVSCKEVHDVTIVQEKRR